MNMIANFLSTIQNKHQLIFIISFLGTPLMLILYSVFKEKYKYIGEYSPNNNNLFQIDVILTLISGTFFYIVYDETIIKSFFAMILFIMFIISIMAIFDLLIENKLIDDKLKLNQELDKITNETLKEYSYKEILAYKVALIREITRKFNPIVTAKAQYFTLYDMKFDGIISHNPNNQPAPKNELDLNVKIMKGIY